MNRISTVAAALALVAGLAAAGACSSSAATSGATSGGAHVPDGTYRVDLNYDDMIAAGVDKFDAAGNKGVQDLTVDGARWTNHSLDNPLNPPCHGSLAYVGAVVSFVLDLSPNCGGQGVDGSELFAASWHVQDDGDLKLDIVRANPVIDKTIRAVFGTQSWARTS
jgi:hypothetical protein